MSIREGHWLVRCLAASKHLQQAQGPWELTLHWLTEPRSPWTRKAVFGLNSSRWQSDPVTCATASRSSALLPLGLLPLVLRLSSKRLFSSCHRSLKETQREIILMWEYWKPQKCKVRPRILEVRSGSLSSWIVGVEWWRRGAVTVTDLLIFASYYSCAPRNCSTMPPSHWVTEAAATSPEKGRVRMSEDSSQFG